MDLYPKELPPEAEALFPGRHLPARENYISSVASVSQWFNPKDLAFDVK
jgi:hypothetical protein